MNLLDWFGGGGSPRPKTPPRVRRNRVYLPDPLGRIGQGTWKPAGDLPDPFGRLNRPEPVSRFPITRDDDEISVIKPVGRRGTNRPADVGQIEQMLGATGHLDIGATDGPTGYYGQRLDNAIRDYQKDRGLKVDGVIKPDGETIQSLVDDFGPTAAPEATNIPHPGDWDRFMESRSAAAKATGGKRLSGPPLSRQDLMDLMDAGDGTANTEGKPPNELDQAIGETLLSLVPGLGEGISAKDAYDAGKAALAALEKGDLADASKMGGLAALSALGAIPVAGTLARAGKGAIKIGKPLLKKFRKQFVDDKDFEGFARRIEDRTPLGFASREDVAKVVGGMQDKLRKSGFDDVTVTMRGSSVTGRKFNKQTGKYDGPGFDAGRESDFDFALVSPKLFEALKQRGVRLRGGRTRTHKVEEDVLEQLGLEGLLPKVSGKSRRKQSVVVYGDAGPMQKRGPFMPID